MRATSPGIRTSTCPFKGHAHPTTRTYHSALVETLAIAPPWDGCCMCLLTVLTGHESPKDSRRGPAVLWAPLLAHTVEEQDPPLVTMVTSPATCWSSDARSRESHPCGSVCPLLCPLAKNLDSISQPPELQGGEAQLLQGHERRHGQAHWFFCAFVPQPCISPTGVHPSRGL